MSIIRKKQILMKRYLITVILLFIIYNITFSQNIGIKSNLAYWSTSTPNLGLEFSLGAKTTLEISGGVNPFNFNDNKKIKHILLQPELRYWFCETFNGHFVGLHAHGSQYNIGGIDIPVGRLDVFSEKRFQGYLYGAGLSYGYQWVLSPSWNFEMSAGGGYAHIMYDEFPCTDCGSKLDEGTYNYFGVTKVAVSLIYIF